MKKKIYILIASVLLLCVCLTACGEDPNKDILGKYELVINTYLQEDWIIDGEYIRAVEARVGKLAF